MYEKQKSKWDAKKPAKKKVYYGDYSSVGQRENELDWIYDEYENIFDRIGVKIGDKIMDFFNIPPETRVKKTHPAFLHRYSNWNYDEEDHNIPYYESGDQ